METTNVQHVTEKIGDGKGGGPSFHCEICDTEVVHKIAQAFLPGLASACVDNTSGDIFRTAGTVADDIRKDMVDYITSRSENFVAESVIFEGGPQAEASDHPFDIISDFVDDFATSKRNLFSRVSGWLLNEKREDRIDDFVQDMKINGFWLIDKRKTIVQTLVKNVDVKIEYHCCMKFNTAEELADHVQNCSFRSMVCDNEGCNAIFSATHMDRHDSTCPFKIISCEQKCEDYIMRRDMDRHCITICPMRLVNCPFYALSCHSTIAHCKLDQHYSDNLNSHLVYILRSVYKESSEDDLKQRAEQLGKESSGRLAETLSVRAFTSKVKDLDTKLGPFEYKRKSDDTKNNMGTSITEESEETSSTEERKGTLNTEETKGGTSNTEDTKATSNTEGSKGTSKIEESKGNSSAEESKGTSITEESKETSNDEENKGTSNDEESKVTLSTGESKSTSSTGESKGDSKIEVMGTLNFEESKDTFGTKEYIETSNSEDSKGAMGTIEYNETSNFEESKGISNAEETKGTLNNEENKETSNAEETNSTLGTKENKETSNAEESKASSNTEESKGTSNDEESKGTSKIEEITHS